MAESFWFLFLLLSAVSFQHKLVGCISGSEDFGVKSLSKQKIKNVGGVKSDKVESQFLYFEELFHLCFWILKHSFTNQPSF